MRPIRAAIIVAVLTMMAGMLPFGTKAEARNQGSLGTIGPDNPVIDMDFPPVPGVYPGAGAHPFAYFRPPMCRTANYCDALELDVEYPDFYLRELFFGVRISLSWDNPRTEENQTGNDVDLFMWPDDGAVSGGPASKCRSPGAAECDFLHPEVITVTEPENTVKDDPEEIDPMFFTVVNHTGVNTGYNIRVEWFTFEIDEPEGFVPPDRAVSGRSGTRPVSTPSGARSDSGRAAGPSVIGPTTEEEARTILVPGPDGELVEMELPIVAAGAEVEPTEEGGGLHPLAIAAIVVGTLAVGLGGLTVWRRRRAGEAPA